MKPNKNLLDQLGVDVELTKKDLDKRPQANELLQRIGKEIEVDGCKYVGTVAIHYYLDKSALLKERYESASITQITFAEDVSETLIATGINNAVIDVRTYCNPDYKFKTTRKNDKRGSVKGANT